MSFLEMLDLVNEELISKGHLALLPQGHPERVRRVFDIVTQTDAEGFGAGSNEAECEAVCPKAMPIGSIARMRRECVRALLIAGK